MCRESIRNITQVSCLTISNTMNRSQSASNEGLRQMWLMCPIEELLSSDIDMVIKEVTTLARSGRYGSRQLAQKVDHLSAKDAIVPDEAWEEHHTNSSALPREKAVDPANQASEAREDDESWTKEDQEMYKMVLAERKGEKV